MLIWSYFYKFVCPDNFRTFELTLKILFSGPEMQKIWQEKPSIEIFVKIEEFEWNLMVTCILNLMNRVLVEPHSDRKETLQLVTVTK